MSLSRTPVSGSGRLAVRHLDRARVRAPRLAASLRFAALRLRVRAAFFAAWLRSGSTACSSIVAAALRNWSAAVDSSRDRLASGFPADLLSPRAIFLRIPLDLRNVEQVLLLLDGHLLLLGDRRFLISLPDVSEDKHRRGIRRWVLGCSFAYSRSNRLVPE
jgi:hypothetical protein